MVKTYESEIHMHLSFEKTPIQSLSGFETDNALYIKRDDLLPFSFGGNKVRIANEFLRDMEEGDYDCMIAYGQSKSNLCRVVSNLCASFRIPCYVVSAIDEGDTYQDTFNSRMVRKFGAKIITCPKTQVAHTLQTLMKQLEEEGLHPYYVYGDIHGKGREAVASRAYRHAYQEIHDYMQANEPFDYIFHASATGTTQAGLIAGSFDHGDPVQIVGISVARPRETGEAAIRENLQALGLFDMDRPICFEDAYRVGGYGKYHDKIRTTIDTMLRYNGIPLDTTYTGKAFWGMLEYLKEHNIKNKRILFIHTGGTPLFFDHLSS